MNKINVTPTYIATLTDWEVMEMIRCGAKAQVARQRAVAAIDFARWQAGEITSPVLACTVNEVVRIEGVYTAVCHGYSTKISEWQTALRNVSGLGYDNYTALAWRVSAF